MRPVAIKPVSIASQLMERIRREILVGNLGPSSRIIEGEIARRWGVSVASVRQALLMLEHEGILARHSTRGAIVHNFSRKEINERNDVRIPLETLACQRAAHHLTDSDYETLSTMVRAMQSDPDADRRFHQYLWEHARHEILEQTLKTVVSPLFTFVPLTRVLLANSNDRIAAHDVLLRAVRSQNADRIAGEVRAHAQAAYDHLFSAEWLDLRSMYEAVRLRGGTVVGQKNDSE